jgi:outer membrane protein TolC
LKLSGQYQRLTNAAVDFKINQNNSGSQEPQPIVNQLMIGQLNSVPVFSGFKIQNSIKVYENLYEAEMATATQTKEDIALRVIDYYGLYKAQKQQLLKEKSKKCTTTRNRFYRVRKNGIIPKTTFKITITSF